MIIKQKIENFFFLNFIEIYSNEMKDFLSHRLFHLYDIHICIYFFSGILTDIQKDFGIGDGSSGLLQTVFIVSYMIFAPLFGYLGDRYNRKIIMSFGVFLWCLTTFIGSFMQVNKVFKISKVDKPLLMVKIFY